jgi:Thrombospondin type 3 repeat
MRTLFLIIIGVTLLLIHADGTGAPADDQGPPRPNPTCVQRKMQFDFLECLHACEAKQSNKRDDADTVCRATCREVEQRAITLATKLCLGDQDGDGIPDVVDACPNTPAGVRVMWNGCPDRDGDNVPDPVDQCPDSPPGARVAVNGCTVSPDCHEGNCATEQPRCRTPAECDRLAEVPLHRMVPRETRERLAKQFLASPAHPVRCPGDHTPPSQPRAVQPSGQITPIEVGPVSVQVVNGVAVSGPTIPLRIAWNPVQDTCAPVTYSILIEYYHCHQIGNLIEPVTYKNRGWCRWIPYLYQSMPQTAFSLDFPMGKVLYDVHVPFAQELGLDLNFTGSRAITYMPFWLRLRLIAHDGNGTPSVFETHGDDRFFVLYADNTVPLQSLSDIPIEP